MPQISSSSASTTLAAVVQALNVAQQATDGVPIVSQIIGVVVRIGLLAEKIDNGREALHDLVEKSQILAQSISQVVADRSPTGQLAKSLERVYRALDAIERFMARHIEGNRFKKVFAYTFTMSKHVGRLTEDLSNAVREFLLVAALDTNNRVAAVHEAVLDDARFDGEFRLVRHSEVQKLGYWATQHIKKNKDELRDLAKSANALAVVIEESVVGYTPHERLERRLQDIRDALQAVKQYMEAHNKKSFFRRLASSAASVAGDVQRLKDDMLLAERRFNVAISADTNLRTVVIQTNTEDIRKWDDGVRILHDGQVDIGDLLGEQPIMENGPVLQYHKAKVTVDGCPYYLIMRSVDEETVDTGGEAAKALAASRLAQVDAIMKEMSKARRKHSNILKVFGWSMSDPLDRFTIFKLTTAQFGSATEFIRTRKEINASSSIALKLMDAAAYLNRFGIDWVPQGSDIRLNDDGEPIIGLDVDLYKKDESNALTVYQKQMDIVALLYDKLPSAWEIRSQIKETRYRLAMELKALPVAQPLARLLATVTSGRKISIAVPKAGFAAQFKSKAEGYLSSVYEKLSVKSPHLPWVWARVMVLLASGGSGQVVRAEYCPSDAGDKVILIWLNGGEATKVWLDLYHVDVPKNKRDQFRRVLDVTSRPTTPDLPTLKLF
ncbi:hypothetical protein AURDEDRAFT_184252 [Auricularia subglabra TFB-10046 SS5]|nr:hypothetical protein AURDEDRAFT_184252 [Auricularia subglabra TFB-10046 SS5]